jgi:ribosome-binding factor A
MSGGGRAARVEAQILREAADILARSVRDPRLALATLVRVKATPDLKLARIYYTLHGGEARGQEVKEALASARGFIKRELSGRLGLKFMPDIQFFQDDSIEYAHRVNQILKDLSKERGERDEDSPDTPGGPEEGA